MTGSPVERARLLLRAGRSEAALEELTAALSASPDDAAAHALKGQALADLGDYPQALQAARTAMGLAPEWAFPHYVTATVFLRSDRPKEALVAAREAVALEPGSADLHALVAASQVGLSRWSDAAEAAGRGLAIEAEHVQCINLRALALRQLGDVDGAEAVLGEALRSDPENAWTFQNLGFAALKAGRADEAIEAFRESLRLDPTDEASRVGLAESLKARVPLYRPVIAWQMLCSRLSTRFGMGLVLGLFLVNAITQRVLPEGSVIAAIVLVAYASLVWMSWAADALFDVLLVLRRDLRPILLRGERLAALGVVACLAIAAVLIGLRIGTGLPGMEWHALAAAFAAIPIAGCVKLANGRARMIGVLIAAAAVTTLLGATALDLYVLQAIDWNASTEITEVELSRLSHHMKQAVTLANVSLLVSVGSTWVLSGLGFVPEARGGRGTRHRPRGTLEE